MSETTRSASESAKRSAHATTDAANKVAKESIGHANEAALHAADRARAVGQTAGQSMTETVAETANAATTMSSRAADQGREAMMAGMRTVAGVGGRVADINFGRGHHLLASTAQAVDIYRDASQRSAGQVNALFSSYMAFSRGVQQMQHAWLEMLDSSIEQAAHKPQDLLRCKNLVELAEVQRDLYVDTVNHVFESSSKLFELAGRTVQDAARPLQAAAH